MRESIKYNTDRYKLVNFETFDDLDFSKVKQIQFKSFDYTEDVQKNIYTDYDNYCVLMDNNTILINQDRYNDDNKILDNIINYILSITTQKEITINDKTLINDCIISTLCNKKNITRVSLGCFSNNPYTLTKEHYEMFKKSNIEIETKAVCEELEDNFDEIILYNKNKKLINYYTYKNLQYGGVISIKEDITDEELKNFKYLNEYSELLISNNNIGDYIKILSKLEELDKDIPVCFEINNENKDEFYGFALNNNINKENIFVKAGNEDRVKLSEFLRYEKTLYEMIKSALDFSPFEKYIYAYNIVKQFKRYNESNVDSKDSRWLYKILENEYMVCVGFSNMFGDLLKKLGIKSINLNVEVDSSLCDVEIYETDFLKSNDIKLERHSRRYVYLKDYKYGIDGFYISDPTWDNDLEKDLYNFMIMTNSEVSNSKSYIGYGYDDIFNVNSLEEYIFKMKRIMNIKYKELEEQIKFILETISDLDEEYYYILCSKYPYVKDLFGSFDIPDNITSLVYDLGNYIVSKVNKTVSGKTIFDGVREVYKHSYGYKEEELEIVLEEVREYNKLEHDKYFPIRYKVNEDGSREIIMNEHNKFDFSLDSVKKM